MIGTRRTNGQEIRKQKKNMNGVKYRRNSGIQGEERK